MKKLLLSSVTIAAMAGTAIAADLASIKSSPVAAPEPLWTGFYAGLNAGGTWSNNSINTTSTPFFSTPAYIYGAALSSTSHNVSNGGFIGGIQFGYNNQINNKFVVGFEADLQGVAGANKSNNRYQGAAHYTTVQLIPGLQVPNTIVDTQTAAASLDYLGTARGRVGFTVTPSLLIYGTGGLAYGGTNISVTGLQIQTTPYGGSFVPGAAHASNVRAGWTAGGGAEWMFLPNMSAKVEYLYYNLGAINLSSGIINYFSGYGYNNELAGVTRVSSQFNGNFVRAGVNYHFIFASAPAIAKY